MVCMLLFSVAVNAETVTFDATTDKGTMAGSSQGDDQVVKSGITIATTPTGSFGNGQQYRVYKGSTFTVSSTVGNITKIEFTCTAAGAEKYGPGSFTDPTTGTYTFSEKVGTWTGDATSVTLTASLNQVRMTQITVTYTPNGGTAKKSADLKFSETKVSVEKGAAFEAPTFTKATTAPVTFTSDNEMVASVNSEGKISLGGELGTAVIKAEAAANEEYEVGQASCTIVVFTYNVYKKATTITSGNSYLLVAQRDGKTMYAFPLDATKNYGYMNAGTVDGLTDEVKVQNNHEDGFVFTEMAGGYSIKAIDTDKYYYHDGTYNTFNQGTDASAWTVEPQADGTFKISQGGYFIQWGQTTYKTWGVYTEPMENAVLPYLYVLDNSSSIGGITADKEDANAPVYNLAGQRVSKDTKGILIKNGKKFINK